MDEVGRQIRDLRLSRGMTQKELGMEVGLKGNYIAAVENNKAGNVRIDTLERIARALRVPLKMLFDQPSIAELQAKGLPSQFISQMERVEGNLTIVQRQQLIDTALAYQTVNDQPKRRGPHRANEGDVQPDEPPIRENEIPDAVPFPQAQEDIVRQRG